MASRLSTPSEGEIVESGSEKAIPSQPSVNGKFVDRPSRTRSPSPRRRDYRARSRSRSPYRESRGSKRPREDDHYSRRDREDTRSFKVHYEGRRGENDRYKDYDRGGSSVSTLRYDDRHSNRRDKRQRTTSRSPPRFGDRRGDHRKPGKDKLASKGRKSSKAQSVSEDQGKDPASSVSLKADAEQKQYQTDRDHLTATEIRESEETANQPSTETLDESLDEATLIEIRRKRREAIKAKHRGQATPLMVQALNISNTTTPSVSNSATPNEVPSKILSFSVKHVVTSLVTPTETPPASPRELSGPNSPSAFQVSKDADLANVQKSTEEDGPSAADYDPTMDMQEDRMRQVSHQQQSEVPDKEYRETVNDKQDVLLPAKTKDDFDMFAEDDMFGAEPPVPKSKAIDMSMLDDWDDADGYYKIIPGELLDGRYHVQSVLGKGVFSAVVRAKDETTKRLFAIKIIRANDNMRKSALKEIDILQGLKEADPEDKKHMIRLERYFEHKGHLCMVFEHLSINLREVLKKFGRDIGINLKAVRAYAQQMFLGLSLMRKCNKIHADLKPDNILVNESRNMLKICDLGSAADASDIEGPTTYLVSRFYRAPEIILGMPLDFAIDTWSIGCTLFELYTGKILFTGRSNNQMLRAIMECRGKFSHKALRKAQCTHDHFDDLLNFRSVEKDKVTGKDIVRILNFTKPTRDLRTRLTSNTKGSADVDMKELNLFIDLLEKCLALNSEKRCTPTEALKHPFIMRNKA